MPPKKGSTGSTSDALLAAHASERAYQYALKRRQSIEKAQEKKKQEKERVELEKKKRRRKFLARRRSYEQRRAAAAGGGSGSGEGALGDVDPALRERKLVSQRARKVGAKATNHRSNVGGSKKTPLAEENFVVGFLGASSEAAVSASPLLSDEGVVDSDAITGAAGTVTSVRGSAEDGDDEEVKLGAGESGDVVVEGVVGSPEPSVPVAARVPKSEPRPRRKKTAAAALAAKVKADKANRRKSWEASSCVNKIEEIQKRREQRR